MVSEETAENAPMINRSSTVEQHDCGQADDQTHFLTVRKDLVPDAFYHVTCRGTISAQFSVTIKTGRVF